MRRASRKFFSSKKSDWCAAKIFAQQILWSLATQRQQLSVIFGKIYPVLIDPIKCTNGHGPLRTPTSGQLRPHRSVLRRRYGVLRNRDIADLIDDLIADIADPLSGKSRVHMIIAGSAQPAVWLFGTEDIVASLKAMRVR